MVKKTILIPPDTSIRQALENSFLHRDTFDIVTAKSGDEALKMIEELDPIVAILDLDMEGLSGDNCCRQIKSDPFLSDTPMALIATSSHPNLLERCEASGCDAILTKPVETRQLLMSLCQMLDIVLRGEPRVEVNFHVRLEVAQERPHNVRVVDLNHGGLFVHTEWLQPAGTPMTLSLSLPEKSGRVKCPVEVVWVNHPEWLKAHRLPVGMGLKFMDADKDFSEAINDLYAAGTSPN